MRTPEQIKNRLECYHRYLTDTCEHLETECQGCELNNTPGYTISEMVHDALLLIGQLENEKAKLVEDLKTVGFREGLCEVCRHKKFLEDPDVQYACDEHFCHECPYQDCMCGKCHNGSNFEWRGVQEKGVTSC